jgi:hypothetical protein
MPTWLPLGKHRYHIEDDLFALEAQGEISLAEIQDLLAACRQIGERSGYWLILVDARAGVSISPEARRYIGEASRGPRPPSVTAIFGAGVIERAFLLFIRSAIRLVRGLDSPVEMFRNGEEARAWLASHRRRLVDRSRKEAGG